MPEPDRFQRRADCRPSLSHQDEFPAEYSLAGCSPAEPASAFPAVLILNQPPAVCYCFSASGICPLSAVAHFTTQRVGSPHRYSSLAAGDFLIRDLDQLGAAAAHLNGDVAKRGPVEAQAGRLAMIRAEHVANLACRVFLELLDVLRTCAPRDRDHKNILARDCSGLFQRQTRRS